MFVYIIYSLLKGTHDLQKPIVLNTSEDTLCLRFKLVRGRQITELHLDMRSGDNHYNNSVTNIRHLHFDHCFNDIPPGNNWTLYVCEVLPNGSNICSNPAVILTNINITGRVSIEPSRTTISTSISDSTSEAPKPSTINRTSIVTTTPNTVGGFPNLISK